MQCNGMPFKFLQLTSTSCKLTNKTFFNTFFKVKWKKSKGFRLVSHEKLCLFLAFLQRYQMLTPIIPLFALNVRET